MGEDEGTGQRITYLALVRSACKEALRSLRFRWVSHNLAEVRECAYARLTPTPPPEQRRNNFTGGLRALVQRRVFACTGDC